MPEKVVPITEIPIQAVLKRFPKKSMPYRQAIPEKSMPYTQAIIAETHPELPVSIPIERRTRRHVPCGKNTSEESFNISSKAAKVLRHVPDIRERNGAIHWKTLVNQCSKGFDQRVNWTCRVAGPPGLLKYRAPFFPCVRGIRVSFSFNLSYKMEEA